MNSIEYKSKEKNENVPKKKAANKNLLNKIFGILTGILGIIVIFVIIYSLILNSKIKKFSQFDLKQLRSQELIFQTYDFNKFIAYGTKQDRVLANDYTDEMNVYYVKGSANLSFPDIANLKTVWEKCDYDKAILYLTYKKPANESMFKIDVVIAPEDIYFVTGIESKTVSIPIIGKDFVKSESPSESIQRAKEAVKKEFEKQILDVEPKLRMKGQEGQPVNLCDNEIYSAFIAALTDLVRSNSSWKSVEIYFE